MITDFSGRCMDLRENNVWDDGGLSDEECGNVVVSPALLLRG